MRRFTQLYHELEEADRPAVKVAALRRYFAEAPPADAAWALWLLWGRRFPKLVPVETLSGWAAEASGFPPWLVRQCAEQVGDAVETATLLLPFDGTGTDLSLADLVTGELQPFGNWEPPEQFQRLRALWPRLDRAQALVFHRMLTGSVRLAASKTLIAQALGAVLGVDGAVVAHRLAGRWQPTRSFFEGLFRAPEPGESRSRPYPFFFASPCENPPAELGPDLSGWLLEWKWNGLRAQLIKRRGELFLASDEEEALAESFPDLLRAAAFAPDGTVMDGEVLIWSPGRDRPEDEEALRKRIGRQRPGARLLSQYPAVFVACDLLEGEGADLRERPLRERRALLERILRAFPAGGALRISPLLAANDWREADRLREVARSRGAGGLVVKHRSSPYRAGQVPGDWWEWKVDPFTAHLVMVYAQVGPGRRRAVYSSYALAAWQGDQLVPVAKVHEGLDDETVAEVDRWIKANTLARRGPVRTVPAALVFEVAFDGFARSARHKSGFVLRQARLRRRRSDLAPAAAETIEALAARLDEGR